MHIYISKLTIIGSDNGCPDNKVHGANNGPIWGTQDPGGPHEPCYLGCHLVGTKPLPEPMLAYCQLDSWEHISVKFESEFCHFH